MNKVLSGYFDDAHRGLQRQQTQGDKGLGTSSSNVQLPPLRPDSREAGGAMSQSLDNDKMTWDKMQQSTSIVSLDFSREQATRGVLEQQASQALQESSKLARRVRQLQDQLAITAAKKEAFKAQAQRLEKEFKRGRDQSDALQKDVLEAKREAAQWNKDASEAMAMMTEMRKAHIHEVRLLQRALGARGGDASSRNKVNEVADLVDKLGRSVVQRDEALRDKTKIQVKCSKIEADLRAVSDDANKLRRQNRQLQESLKEAIRKARFVPPKTDADAPEDSDEEFEHELSAFEKRFEILEEGPAGLDILASNLSKDKQNLEKRLRVQSQTVKSLNASVENWKQLCSEKDFQIQDLSEKLDKMMKDQARLQEEIAAKRREIELQVAEEKAALERRISELELECDNARMLADGMDKASNRLSEELQKVHDEFSSKGPAKKADPPPVPAMPNFPEEQATDLVTSSEQAAATGELLSLEIYKSGVLGAEVYELHGKEVSGGEMFRVSLSPDLIKELDQEDPWTELFSRTGVTTGPPRSIVISALLGRREVALQPSGRSVILAVYRYDSRRFLLSGLDLESQKLLDLAITEETMPDEIGSLIDGCDSDTAVFDAFAEALSLDADGAVMSLGSVSTGDRGNA